MLFKHHGFQHMPGVAIAIRFHFLSFNAKPVRDLGVCHAAGCGFVAMRPLYLAAAVFYTPRDPGTKNTVHHLAVAKVVFLPTTFAPKDHILVVFAFLDHTSFNTFAGVSPPSFELLS